MSTTKGTPRSDLLAVESLCVSVEQGEVGLPVVRDVSLTVGDGESVAVVGESGSGKSMTVGAIAGLQPSGARVTAGKVLFGGRDLTKLREAQMRAVRGAEIGFVFQDPMTALNPVLTIGKHVREAIAVHSSESERRASTKEAAVEVLRRVGLPDPRRQMRMYPHELSGGMRQRVLIGMAVANSPRLLIADEPTTALDVTTQAEILELMVKLRSDSQLAVILVSHDLGVVSEVADRVLVMYAGQVVECGRVTDVFRSPQHPYTAALLASHPARLHGRDLHQIPGMPPDPVALPTGCPFHPRCDVVDRSVGGPCQTQEPLPLRVARGSACHYPERVQLSAPDVSDWEGREP